MRRQRILISLAVAIILACSWRAQAATTDTLQDLVDTGGSLSIGDKVFSDFDYFASGLTSFDASQIRVTASFSNGIYYLTWAGNMSLVSSGGPASADLLLNYTVTATSGLISMIDQSYTGSAQPSGGTFLSIDETARDSHGVVVANSHLQADDLSDPFAETGDNLNINPPQQTLSVTKDIGFAVVNGGFVTVSQVSQSFHQVVPEPGTMTMLITGTALLGWVSLYRRRRS
jgi:hypothetical protein